jgi:hypothetical protein
MMVRTPAFHARGRVDEVRLEADDGAFFEGFRERCPRLGSPLARRFGRPASEKRRNSVDLAPNRARPSSSRTAACFVRRLLGDHTGRLRRGSIAARRLPNVGRLVCTGLCAASCDPTRCRLCHNRSFSTLSNSRKPELP